MLLLHSNLLGLRQHFAHSSDSTLMLCVQPLVSGRNPTKMFLNLFGLGPVRT